LPAVFAANVSAELGMALLPFPAVVARCVPSAWGELQRYLRRGRR
jgi:hypothetical protein